MQEFTKRVIHIIRGIPAGYVMTYGNVATAAGNKKGARQVSWLLHSLSNTYNLPWHRIINVKGEVSLKGTDQQAMLEREGVVFNEQGKVNLDLYQWTID